MSSLNRLLKTASSISRPTIKLAGGNYWNVIKRVGRSMGYTGEKALEYHKDEILQEAIRRSALVRGVKMPKNIKQPNPPTPPPPPPPPPKPKGPSQPDLPGLFN